MELNLVRTDEPGIDCVVNASGQKPRAARALTREQRRSRRKREVRARTICVKRVSKRDLELGRELYPEVTIQRPLTRADCIDGARPCPFISCKHHLYLDVSSRTGSIKLNFPDLEVWEMKNSCALDVADEGGTTLEGVGAIMNVTRERVRQLEIAALGRLATVRDMKQLRLGDDADYREEFGLERTRAQPGVRLEPGSRR